MKSKKIFKKLIFSLALAVGLARATAAVGSFAETVDGIKYNLDNTNHTASVTTHTNSELPSNYNMTIPSTINVDGTIYAVTTIENNAFKSCTRLKTVTILEGAPRLGTLHSITVLD